MRVCSNLKALLDERGESIRGFAQRCDLPFETVRRMYNDTTMQYQRDSVGRMCEVLNVEISDLLILNEEKRPNREG